MERGIIKIENDEIILPDTPVWMTIGEMSDLFMVSAYGIRKALRQIFRSGIMDEPDAVRLFPYAEGCYAEAYNMEAVAAVAFRINAAACRRFRELMLRRFMEKSLDFYICIPATAIIEPDMMRLRCGRNGINCHESNN